MTGRIAPPEFHHWLSTSVPNAHAVFPNSDAVLPVCIVLSLHLSQNQLLSEQIGQCRTSIRSSCYKDLLTLSFSWFCSLADIDWVCTALNKQCSRTVVFHAGVLSWHILS